MRSSIKKLRNLGLAQARKKGAHMRQIDFTFRFLARKDQVQQRVIRQIQQARQGVDFLVGEAFLVFIEKARQDEVVFKQTAPAAPAQARSIGRIGLMRHA